MSILRVLREAINDDITHLASSTRIALLSATWTLCLALLYAEFLFAIQLALLVKGAEGWVAVIDKICVCLAAVLVGYATKMIAGIWRKPEGGPNE